MLSDPNISTKTIRVERKDKIDLQLQKNFKLTGRYTYNFIYD